jgi:hypothetical protein
VAGHGDWSHASALTKAGPKGAQNPPIIHPHNPFLPPTPLPLPQQEDPALAGRGDDAALAALRTNAWNVVITDTLAFDAGYGPETVFSCLTDAPPPVQAHPGRSPEEANAAAAAAAGLGAHLRASVVAPYQVVNHLPNSSALTNKASLIRALNRHYTTGASATHVFDVVPSTYFLPSGTRTEADSPTLAQFYRRFAALAHGHVEGGGVRMPAKHCGFNMWVIKPAGGSSGGESVVVNSAADISTFLAHMRGDFVLQKYVERPLTVNGAKSSVRLWVLVTDSGDVFVYRAPLVHLASLPYVAVTVAETATLEECRQVHVTSPEVQVGAPGYGAIARGNAISWAELQAYLNATTAPDTFPPDVLDTIILPRMKRIVVDAVRGAFSAPMPPDGGLGTASAAPALGGGGSAGGAPSSAAAASSSAAGSASAPSQNPRAGFRGRRCFELLSADFVLDEDLRPWFLGFGENPTLTLPETPRFHATADRMAAEAVTIALDPLLPAPLLPGAAGAASSSSSSSNAGKGGRQPHHLSPSSPEASSAHLGTPGFDPSAYLDAAAATPTGPAALQTVMAGQQRLAHRALSRDQGGMGDEGGAEAEEDRGDGGAGAAHARTRQHAAPNAGQAHDGHGGNEFKFVLPSLEEEDGGSVLVPGRRATAASNPLGLPPSMVDGSAAPTDGTAHQSSTQSSATTTRAASAALGASPDGFEDRLRAGGPFFELVYRAVSADDVETPAYTSMLLAALTKATESSGGTSSSGGGGAGRMQASVRPSAPLGAGGGLAAAVQAQIAEALSLTLPPRSRGILSLPAYAFLGPQPARHRLAWLSTAQPQSALALETAGALGPSGRLGQAALGAPQQHLQAGAVSSEHTGQWRQAPVPASPPKPLLTPDLAPPGSRAAVSPPHPASASTAQAQAPAPSARAPAPAPASAPSFGSGASMSAQQLALLAHALTSSGIAGKVDPTTLPALAALLQGRLPAAPAQSHAHASANAAAPVARSSSVASARPPAAPASRAPPAAAQPAVDGRLLNTATARARATAVQRKMNAGPVAAKKSARWADIPSRIDTGPHAAVGRGGAGTSGARAASSGPRGSSASFATPAGAPRGAQNLHGYGGATEVTHASAATLAAPEEAGEVPRHMRGTAASVHRKQATSPGHPRGSPSHDDGAAGTGSPSPSRGAAQVHPRSPVGTMGGGSATGRASWSPAPAPAPAPGPADDPATRALLLTLLSALQQQQQRPTAAAAPAAAAPAPAPVTVPAPQAPAQAPAAPPPFFSQHASAASSAPAPTALAPAPRPRVPVANEFSAFTSAIGAAAGYGGGFVAPPSQAAPAHSSTGSSAADGAGRRFGAGAPSYEAMLSAPHLYSSTGRVIPQTTASVRVVPPTTTATTSSGPPSAAVAASAGAPPVPLASSSSLQPGPLSSDGSRWLPSAAPSSASSSYAAGRPVSVDVQPNQDAVTASMDALLRSAGLFPGAGAAGIQGLQMQTQLQQPPLSPSAPDPAASRPQPTILRSPVPLHPTNMSQPRVESYGGMAAAVALNLEPVQPQLQAVRSESDLHLAAALAQAQAQAASSSALAPIPASAPVWGAGRTAVAMDDLIRGDRLPDAAKYAAMRGEGAASAAAAAAASSDPLLLASTSRHALASGAPVFAVPSNSAKISAAALAAAAARGRSVALPIAPGSGPADLLAGGAGAAALPSAAAASAAGSSRGSAYEAAVARSRSGSVDARLHLLPAAGGMPAGGADPMSLAPSASSVWVRVPDPQGGPTSCYFYNAATRSTSWDMPTGPGITIIDQP